MEDGKQELAGWLAIRTCILAHSVSAIPFHFMVCKFIILIKLNSYIYKFQALKKKLQKHMTLLQ